MLHANWRFSDILKRNSTIRSGLGPALRPDPAARDKPRTLVYGFTQTHVFVDSLRRRSARLRNVERLDFTLLPQSQPGEKRYHG